MSIEVKPIPKINKCPPGRAYGALTMGIKKMGFSSGSGSLSRERIKWAASKARVDALELLAFHLVSGGMSRKRLAGVVRTAYGRSKDYYLRR